ncbi:ribosome biogenesis regulatory protein homolog isoform X2 [Anopheles nili]|uniref:ribosome biogenesis regulatory protein homolog isoform X2 n=1 Tax=Anopheles nili TaxID=185578 RepID=UPI00237C4A01|nr:ribosome biogenesis regulatory protein homolog isoform X2 [Anopheles nili]
MDIVKEILDKQQQTLQKYKPITVQKSLDPTIDAGHLLVSDPNYFDDEQMKADREKYVLDLTRDNVQLLINDVWQLPTERVDESIVAKLPPPKTLLPRSRKLPVPKPLTKWEEFAKKKGIKKRTREKKVFDPVLDKWVPTYGYQRYKAEKERDWALDVPQNDPYRDMFKEKRDLRIERVAKNEVARMKNIARAKKIAVPRTGFVGPESASAKQLITASNIVKASTASVGVFQESLPNEKQARGIGVKELLPGVNRKKKTSSMAGEKRRNMEIVTKVLNKKPKIDIDRAISLQKAEARAEREADEGVAADGKKSKKGGKKSKASFSRKKPKGGQGKRNHSKRTVGRKRR